MRKEKDDTSERELNFSRLLDAPVELVWDIWTKPEHIKHWWGPYGFTTTILKMDVKPGGEWNFIMHSPEGTDHYVKSVFKEIVKYKKIVCEQSAQFGYVATIEFESRGAKTFISWTLLFESKAYLIQSAKAFKVDVRLQEHAQKLINYLSQVNQKTHQNESN